MKKVSRAAKEEIIIDGVTILSNATFKNLNSENSDFDINPDYIFLIKGSWAPIIISELMMLNLKVTEIISKHIKY